MGYLRQFGFFFFLAIMPCISAAMAAEIRTSPYEYDYGKTAANFKGREVMVICEICPPRRQLTLNPRIAAILAVRAADVPTPIITDYPSTSEKQLENERTNDPPTTAITGSNRPDYARMPTIYFRFNRFDVSDYEKDQLDRLISRLKKQPDRPREIRIVGHTCNLGSDTYNDHLSLMRAKFVADYLERNGFKVSQVKGEGKHSPVSKIGKLNRRAEIEIIH